MTHPPHHEPSGRRRLLGVAPCCRRVFVALCVAAGGLCGVQRDAAGQAVSSPAGPPNIILIFVDDQSWNGTSVRMDPDDPRSASDFYQTPNLERLAAEGMVFSNAYSAAGVCSPTRAALATGMSPGQLQHNDIYYTDSVRGFGGHPLVPPQVAPLDAESVVGLGERVQQAGGGYATGLIGKWHVAGAGPEDLGFDYFDEVRVSSPEDPRTIGSKTDAAIDFMTQHAEAEQPFFLQLSHIAVHSPFIATQESTDLFAGLPPGSVHNDVTYAAYTHDLDIGVGRILDEIDALGIADNTYVIYASDNGATNNVSRNDQLFSGKKSIFEGGIRTPLIISGPGIAPGSYSDVPVTTVDLYATISALAGNQAPLPAGVEGADLSPLLFNAGALPEGMQHLERAHSEGGALFFLSPSNIATGPNYRLRPMAAVRRGDYKLIRVFGENGGEDQLLLFNLAQNPTETETLNSTLNLADDLPELTAELALLLDNWVQSADVSLPYDVAAPTSILWSADRPGAADGVWRSVTDVDQRFRESWSVEEDGPRVIASGAFQPGVADQAFFFDGASSASRQFFHVSDNAGRLDNRRYPTGTPDHDRSVSFELWVQLADLAGPHALLETGSAERGLSVTIVDADGDGLYTDARFTVAGASGQTLTATADLARSTNPVGDFVHLVVVLDDSPDNRHAAIYANGQELTRVAGQPGADGTLHWDQFIQGFDAATLGASDPTSPGASLRGALAGIAFHNFSLTGADVAQRYNGALDPVRRGVLSVGGDAKAATYRPTSVAAGSMEESGVAVVLEERHDVLDADLLVDLLVGAGGPGVLEAGSGFASYLIHFDPVGDPSAPTTVAGSVTFAGEVLGLIFDAGTLDATDTLLGTVGEHATGQRTGGVLAGDLLMLSGDGRTLDFSLTATGAGVAQLRVITAGGFAGDFNGDGAVDGADYAVWRAEVDRLAVDAVGDANGDGFVNEADLELFQQNFGRAAGPGEAIAGDFNGDGAVDGADYALWRDNLSQGRLRGDADRDGDVDLQDLALWQRDFGSVERFTASGLAGDFNGDGSVDASDYAVWRNALASQDLTADADGDNDVDADDLEFWRINFGAAASPVGLSSAATPAPEPASVVLVSGLLLAGLFRRRAAGR
ncbi:MAG: sulfatase-like hydrolase/transferase [Planctomycetota bacterium]